MTEQSGLKATLQHHLTEAIRSQDKVRAGTLRMVLTAVTTEEVAGKAHRQLSEEELLRVVAREAKKRREAAEAYGDAGRSELAAREEADEVRIGARREVKAARGESLAAVRDARERGRRLLEEHEREASPVAHGHDERTHEEHGQLPHPDRTRQREARRRGRVVHDLACAGTREALARLGMKV